MTGNHHGTTGRLVTDGGCPFHGGGPPGDADADAEDDPEADGDRDGTTDDRGGAGIDRREFGRAALSIGGASALSTVLGMFGMPGRAAAAGNGRESESESGDEDGSGGAPAIGSPSIAERANRQHSWNAYERRAHGTFLPPRHHLLLFGDYEGADEPTAADRTEMRAALDRLEEIFGWHHEGLLFTVGYSTSYFDRFGADPPRGLRTDNGAIPRMLSARQLIDGPTIPVLNVAEENPDLQPTESEREEERTIDLQVTLEREDPVADDHYDVCLHLASDHVQHLLAAEQALWGERDAIDGVPFGDATLEGILTRPTEYPDRRVGFVGTDALEDAVDVGAPGSTTRDRFEESVAAGAELSMGYNDLYRNSMPREDNVTMLEDQRFLPGPPNWQPPGPFANGTIMHVSRLDNDLEGWYGENTDTERRHRMFSPHHTEADVGEVGENLAPRASNAPTAAGKDPADRRPMRDVSNDVTDVAERTEADFREGRAIGHAQKAARARAQLEAHFRNEDGGPPLDVPQRDDPVARERDDDLSGHDATDQGIETGFLRRDFNTVDAGRPGTHFVALQAFSIYLAYTRHAMNGIDFDTAMIAQPTTADSSAGFEHESGSESESDGANPTHGILEYITTRRRGNFVVPPITGRALPHPDAIRLVGAGAAPETGLGGAPLPPYVGAEGEFTLRRAGEAYLLRIEDDALAAAIDPASVRFGFYRSVNAGGGAAPLGGEPEGVYAFPVDGTDLPAALAAEADDDERPDDATVRARLYAERAADRKPVLGTTVVAGGPGWLPEVGARPADPDGDGRYEDVDGDGEVDVFDVAAFLEAYDGEAVAGNPAAFDFDGSGEVDIADVQALLDRV